MIIFPAIDIMDSRCVRLEQGDFEKETTYNANPLEVAKKFEKEGAEFIHVVDLDAAKTGDLNNFKIISKIISGVGVPIEVGGGVRDIQSAKQYIEAGASRIVVGTAALQDPEFLSDLCLAFADKVSLGIDVKDEYIYTHGWTKNSEIFIWDYLKEISALPLASIIVTDIDRDGMMSGANFKLYEKLCENTHHNVVVSGGVSEPEEVKKLSSIGVYGVVVGKALYEGKVNLEEIIHLAKEN